MGGGVMIVRDEYGTWRIVDTTPRNVILEPYDDATRATWTYPTRLVPTGTPGAARLVEVAA
jgi:hypothetical protein